jgi:hypothetical protein
MATLSNWNGDVDLKDAVPDSIANRLQPLAPPATRSPTPAPNPEPLLRWRLPASVRKHRSQPWSSFRRTRA